MANNTVVSEKPVMANVVTKAQEKEAVVVVEEAKNGGVLGYAIGTARSRKIRELLNDAAKIQKKHAAQVFAEILEKGLVHDEAIMAEAMKLQAQADALKRRAMVAKAES